MQSKMGGAIFLSTGSYVPETSLSTQEVIDRFNLDTTAAWVEERIGIKHRRWAHPNQQCSDLAVEAAIKAMKDAGVKADDIDGVIMSAGFGDRMYPATAPVVAKKLGLRSAFAFDVQSACSGFLVGLQVARRFCLTNPKGIYLVVGADVGSRGVKYDHKDRTLGVIFGDGAGAALLTGSPDRDDFVCDHIGTDPEEYEVAGCRAGGSEFPLTPELVARGQHFGFMVAAGIKKNALRRFPFAIQRVCEIAGMRPNEVDFFVCHQANLRIIETLFEQFKIPMSKTFTTIERYGNCGNASIAITLDETRRAGHLKKGATVCLVAAGAGFTWASMLLRWGMDE